MRSTSVFLSIAVTFFAWAARPAVAYIDMAPTLARVVREAQTICVVEVEKFSLEKGAVLLKSVRDLKGTAGNGPIKHRLQRANEAGIDQPILEWAEPGRSGVLFVSGKTALVCLGRGWYQVQADADGWWQLGAARPDLPLTFYGHVSRLAAAIPVMLADRTAIITTLPHNNDEQSDFDLPLNRAVLPGLVKLQRLRVSVRMPQMVMAVSGNPAYVIGPGAAGDDEIPELIERLQSADPLVRAESADDLGSLGAKGVGAANELTKLLNDTAAGPRLAAAAALLRIGIAEPRAVAVLETGLDDPDTTVRRAAARATGLAGAPAAALAKKLGTLLADADVVTRGAALQAIATLGPAGADAVEPVTRLLETPATKMDAADALGRIGPAARPALKKLAKLLESDVTTQRWAAVRAMSQIGGDEAAPAVQFMIRELRSPSVVDAYNMMIYLALLGPVAKEAIPAIQSSRQMMNPVLKPATIWAIDPSGKLPWQNGFGPGSLPGGPGGPGPGFGPPGGFGGGGNDFAGWIYESYVRELGDRLEPTALSLAKKIMDGSAGDVPPWAYKLLARFPDETLRTLSAGLSDKELVQRERAAVAIGYMGSAAAATRPQVESALAKAANEREEKLLQWCLREITSE